MRNVYSEGETYAEHFQKAHMSTYGNSGAWRWTWRGPRAQEGDAYWLLIERAHAQNSPPNLVFRRRESQGAGSQSVNKAHADPLYVQAYQHWQLRTASRSVPSRRASDIVMAVVAPNLFSLGNLMKAPRPPFPPWRTLEFGIEEKTVSVCGKEPL